MYAYIKFGDNRSICSQDVEQKQNYDALTEGQTLLHLDSCWVLEKVAKKADKTSF